MAIDQLVSIVVRKKEQSKSKPINSSCFFILSCKEDLHNEQID